jgi:hypothetical protein
MTSRGERVKVTSFREPHKRSSVGKVCVDHLHKDAGNRGRTEYFVSVIGAEWIEREDRTVCPTCDAWTDALGDCINHCVLKEAKEARECRGLKTYSVIGHRIFKTEDGFKRMVDFPSFLIEASSRTEANLKLGTILHTTLTETVVSFEEV